MIKKFTFVIITLIFVSCGIDHTDFSGDWIDKKNERDRMIIKKNGDNYIVESREKKYPAQIKDGLLEISAELPIKATIDENENLIIAGNEYIRYKNSVKPKFVGNWKLKKFETKDYPYQCRTFSYNLLIRLNDKNNFVINGNSTNERGETISSDFSSISYKRNKISANCKYYHEIGTGAPQTLVNNSEYMSYRFNKRIEIEKVSGSLLKVYFPEKRNRSCPELTLIYEKI